MNIKEVHLTEEIFIALTISKEGFNLASKSMNLEMKIDENACVFTKNNEV